MATLHALLVAINEYEKYPLKGCVNDMKAFGKYLEAFCRTKGFTFHTKELINGEATRENIFSAFDMFKGVAADDICLLYFAGHGSHYTVPPQFRHLEPDGEVETFVCYDSRLKDGRDLVDKELSYLIWEVSQTWKEETKKRAFITVMDSCHSGSFRSQLEDEAEVLVREVPGPSWQGSPEEFYGYENYLKEGNRVAPPLARRIHLGAARDMETAKEVKIGGRRRGIFTFSLLDTLEKSKGIIPYDELIKRINSKVRKAVSDQSSQLMVSEVADKRLRFLTNISDPEKENYLIEHSRENGWTIDAGALHGIPDPADNGELKTVFKLLEYDREVEITKVMAHQSVVESMEGLNVNTSYSAILKQVAEPRFKLIYAEDIDAAGKDILDEAIKEKQSDLFNLISDSSEADFILQAQGNAFSIYRTGEKKIEGLPVEGFSKGRASYFLDDVETILRWYKVYWMENLRSTINKKELAISLKQVTDPGNYENDTKAEDIKDWSSPTRFDYVEKDGKWHQPAFQLKIANVGHRPLHISLLYLSATFSITNQLIDQQLLNPPKDGKAGDEVWVLDTYEGKNYITIPLQLEDHFLKRGRDTIEETFKLLISTHPFSTDRFNQNGIEWDDTKRSLGLRGGSNRASKPDWLSLEIPILIHRNKASL